MDLRVQVAQPWHANYLCGHLRQADYEEVWNAGHRDADESLIDALNTSEDRFTLLVGDGTPIAIGGVSQSCRYNNIGIPWMFASDDVSSFWFGFARKSRGVARAMQKKYKILVNWVGATRRESIQWLEWCGFNVGPPEPFGPEDVLFCRFWSKNNW